MSDTENQSDQTELDENSIVCELIENAIEGTGCKIHKRLQLYLKSTSYDVIRPDGGITLVVRVNLEHANVRVLGYAFDHVIELSDKSFKDKLKDLLFRALKEY